MSLATLFEKLQEHEMELQRLNQHEENDKRKKGIALKASSSIQEESDNEDLEEDGDLNLFVKIFNKFLKMRGNQRCQNFKPKRRTEESSQTLRCYECNQPGHLRADCPTFKKRMEKSEKKNFALYLVWRQMVHLVTNLRISRHVEDQ